MCRCLLRRCSRWPGCSAYQYAANGNCSFYLSGAKGLKSEADTTCGVAYPAPVCAPFLRQLDYWCQCAAGTTTTVSSEFECQQRCCDLPGCVMYNLELDETESPFKLACCVATVTSTYDKSGWVGHTCGIIEPAPFTCTASSFSQYNSFSCEGSLMAASSATTWWECVDTCCASPHCAGASWSGSEGERCYLYQDVVGFKASTSWGQCSVASAVI